MKNWKTTLAGISALLVSMGALLHDVSIGDYSKAVPELIGIVTGLGLLFAKDHNVTGGTVRQ